MIIGNNNTTDVLAEFLAHALGKNGDHTIIIQSPLLVLKETIDQYISIFPLWIEYYRYKNLLNNPYKIAVIGTEWEYHNLSYYLAPSEQADLADRLKTLLTSEMIDYSTTPGDCSGKRAVSVFFRGHGDGNIRGVLGNITHYINNGILHLKESGDSTETEEIFFKPAAVQLSQLEQRLTKYDDFFRYLPWEEEITGLKQMTQQVRLFLNAPQQYPDYKGLKDLVSGAYKSISQLMNIHKIDETAGKSGKS